MDIEKLEKLNELKEKGILTEEEFNIQKKELLSNNEQSQNVSKKQNEQDLSLGEYFVKCMTEKYLCFDGRARRKEYFAYILCSNLITFVIGFVLGLLTVSLHLNPIIFDIISTFVNIAFLVPSITVLIRRMHDVNMSGWWILTLIVPLIAIFFKSDMNKNKYGEVPAGILR